MGGLHHFEHSACVDGGGGVLEVQPSLQLQIEACSHLKTPGITSRTHNTIGNKMLWSCGTKIELPGVDQLPNPAPTVKHGGSGFRDGTVDLGQLWMS